MFIVASPPANAEGSSIQPERRTPPPPLLSGEDPSGLGSGSSSFVGGMNGAYFSQSKSQVASASCSKAKSMSSSQSRPTGMSEKARVEVLLCAVGAADLLDRLLFCEAMLAG